MSFRIDVQGDVREIRRTLSALGTGVDRAASRALNKTATTVRAQAARDIRKQRALKATVIKQALAIRRATYRRLTAVIEASGRPIPIRHFGANLTKRGVTVRIKTGGKRQLLKRGQRAAFMNPGSKIGPNVFVRLGSKRLPIVKWPPVPGIPRVFVQDAIVAHMKRTAATTWAKRFDEELRYEINKALRAARGG